jgi:hypothetical protein
MAKNGDQSQQPGAGEAAKSADNKTAGTLEELLDAMDGESGEEATETTETTDVTETTETAEETEESEESGEETETEEGAEDEEGDADERKSVFSDEAYKIFKQRIGHEKAKREKVAAKLSAAEAEIETLKKSADPVMREAISAGIDEEFLDANSAKVISAASKLTRQIAFLRDAAKNPEGFEDNKGNVYSQAELAAQLSLLVSDPDNMAVLVEARSVRKDALARQKEAIAEGLKVIKAREAVAKGLKTGADKSKSKSKVSAPPAPGGAAAKETSASTGDYREKYRKSGRTIDDLIESTM